uniref:Uncharacterized protein orf392 n=1 Tax=Chaetosphaeridium globosum TaxID=96477 RepID=Q8M1H4_CHAGL|nr:hypothetical protein ChglpMp03 [Chaetosphaeridium globosum]AAM96634.1 hypothetical protein [Chaetosphaeridium globosum]
MKDKLRNYPYDLESSKAINDNMSADVFMESVYTFVDNFELFKEFTHNTQYLRYFLQFSTIGSNSTTTFYLPEVDTLILRSPHRKLFSVLKHENKAGRESQILNYLVSLEKNVKEGQLGYNNTFFKVTFIGPDKGGPYYLYKINGGFPVFYRLASEHVFLFTLLRAIKNKHCQIHRLDLSIDTNEDLMLLLTENVKKRHYISPKRRLYVYALINGIAYKGPFGHRSKKFVECKDSNILLETVYFGSKHQEISICFYDKKLEQRKQKNNWKLGTRIEIRFRNKLNNPDFGVKLLQTYFEENQRTVKGWVDRLALFVKVFERKIQFTDASKKQICPWWSGVIGPLATLLDSIACDKVFFKDFSEFYNKIFLLCNNTNYGFHTILETYENGKNDNT